MSIATKSGKGLASGERDQTEDGNAWGRRADELARWALRHLVVRHDAQGAHYTEFDRDTCETKVCRTTSYVGLDHDELAKHFGATTTDQIRGVHTASSDERCRVAVVDIDNHSNQEDLIEINREFAIQAYNDARSLGFAAMLVAGNREGSFHLWVLLGCLNPMQETHRLCRWLVRHRAAAGLPKNPDLFPGSCELRGEKRMGTWIRMPGRHHKRPVWSTVWCPARREFLKGEEAVAAILAIDPPPIVVSQVVPSDYVYEPSLRTREVSNPAPRSSPPLRSYERRRTIRLADDALTFLWEDAYEYDSWVRLGMCLTGLEEDGRTLFHLFSSVASCKYFPREVDAKWATFAEGGDGRQTLGLGTLFYEAKQSGWLGLDYASLWDKYQDAVASGDPMAEELIDDVESELQLEDEARDVKFSLTCDEAVAHLAIATRQKTRLANWWEVSPDTIERLGVGWRRDQVRQAGVYVPAGSWAWTIPISSGSALERPLTVGYHRIYPGAPQNDRLGYGSRDGLILPWDVGGRPGPLVICTGAYATAKSVDAGQCAVGLTDASLSADDLEIFLASEWLESREILILPTPGEVGHRRAHELLQRISTRRKCTISVRQEPAPYLPASRSKSRPGGKSTGFSFVVSTSPIKK